MMVARGRARLAGIFAGRLELDRRVMDVKPLGQPQLDLALDLGPARQVRHHPRRHALPAPVLLVELPQMQVVNLDDARRSIAARAMSSFASTSAGAPSMRMWIERRIMVRLCQRMKPAMTSVTTGSTQ